MNNIRSAAAALAVSLLLAAEPLVARHRQLPVTAAGFTAAWLKNGKPVKLEQAIPAGTKTAGAGRTFLSAGIAKPQVYWWFRGAHAQVQVSDTRPVFELHAPYLPASSIVIVRLQAKKKERDLRVSTGAMIFSAGSGFDSKEVEPAKVTEKGDGVLDLAVSEDLPPGEYLITREGMPFGYDFEIVRPAQAK